MTVAGSTGHPRRGFTLVELLAGLGVIAVVLAILLPVLLGARQRAQEASCLFNVRQISVALTLYTQDDDGFFPPENVADWDRAVSGYVTDRRVFRCPSCPVPPAYDEAVPGLPIALAKGYALNFNLYDARHAAHTRGNPALPEIAVRFPASTVSVCEVAYRNGPQAGATSTFINRQSPDDGRDLLPGQSFAGPPGASRHQGGSDYAFVDGHVRWYKPDQVADAKQAGDGRQPSFGL